jgi:hypothetical protein
MYGIKLSSTASSQGKGSSKIIVKENLPLRGSTCGRNVKTQTSFKIFLVWAYGYKLVKYE